MITFNENNNQLILTDEEQQSILDKFPDKLKPFLSKCNNPLDETQVLVNLFKDKNVRIILREEENKFGDLHYASYFHAEDIAKQLHYSQKNISQWKTRWNITFSTYENLLLQFEGVKLTNDRRTNKDANFINEQDLKKVLIKINTDEAKIFQDWILEQSLCMKAIINNIIKIKHEQDIDKYKQQLEQHNKTKDNLMERTLKAVENYKQPVRNAGKIYIATSPEYQKQFTYKIGLTTIETAKREKSLQTSCPNINIIYDVDVKDVDLAESLIHTYLNHLNVDKEFYYISSVTIAKDIVNYCCNFINNLIIKYDNDYNILRKQYIDSNDIIITLPLIQSRGRSPNKKHYMFFVLIICIYANY